MKSKKITRLALGRYNLKYDIDGQLPICASSLSIDYGCAFLEVVGTYLLFFTNPDATAKLYYDFDLL